MEVVVNITAASGEKDGVVVPVDTPTDEGSITYDYNRHAGRRLRALRAAFALTEAKRDIGKHLYGNG